MYFYDLSNSDVKAYQNWIDSRRYCFVTRQPLTETFDIEDSASSDEDRWRLTIDWLGFCNSHNCDSLINKQLIFVPKGSFKININISYKYSIYNYSKL